MGVPRSECESLGHPGIHVALADRERDQFVSRMGHRVTDIPCQREISTIYKYRRYMSPADPFLVNDFVTLLIVTIDGLARGPLLPLDRPEAVFNDTVTIDAKVRRFEGYKVPRSQPTPSAFEIGKS